jgi:hypothetical protein
MNIIRSKGDSSSSIKTIGLHISQWYINRSTATKLLGNYVWILMAEEEYMITEENLNLTVIAIWYTLLVTLN